jgi:hypothetical protein
VVKRNRDSANKTSSKETGRTDAWALSPKDIGQFNAASC